MDQDETELHVQGIAVPAFLYGTAWKESATAGLVEEAVRAGFRGIDTANQRKHYIESAVGDGLAGLYESGQVSREELFIQTKFTSIEGQDHRLPYDSKAGFRVQVSQSLRSSLEHLGATWVDSLLIHGPQARDHLTAADREIWEAMEDLYGDGATRLIGISNVTERQVAELVDLAKVPPAFVQNRCYARLGWDREVRSVCRANGIVYQGFSLLTANVREIRSSVVQRIAVRHKRTLPQIVFRFAHQSGMICLTGTTDASHMREDLAIFDFELSRDEMTEIESLAVQ